MELKGRLLEVAKKIPVCDTLIDVGTDHAYIPVYTVEKGICKRSLAADLRKGPVEIAKRNINRFGLADFIGTACGNGLEPVEVGSDDVIVIAGMGGLLIKELLESSYDKAKKAKLLVLQPMNAADALRAWLCGRGFEIVEEALAEDAGKLYNIICSRWTGFSNNPDGVSCFLGLGILNGSDPLLKKYLQKRLSQLEVVIKGRSAAVNKREGLEGLIMIRDMILKRLKEL